MAILRMYCATGLIGGTTGDLDTIDGADLANNDMCMVVDSSSSTVYFYKMNTSGAQAESSPTVIVPNDNNDNDNKNWELQSLYVNDITISDDIILATDDVKVGDFLEVVGSMQIGDADGTGANATFYSNTAGDHMVFDKTAKTFTLTDINLVSGTADIAALGGGTPGSIVGTTIDAGTDFTVGNTVITDGVLTDAGGFKVAGALEVTGTFQVGDDNGTGANQIWYSNTSGDIMYYDATAKTFELTDIQFSCNDVDINGGSIDGVTIGAASAPTVTDLGSVTTCDINGGTISGVTIDGSLTWSAAQDLNNQALTNVDINSGAIDGVTIGGAAAPTVTDLGSVATCDINGGSVDGITLGAAATATFTSITAANTGQISWGDGIPNANSECSGETEEVDVDQNTVGATGCLVLSADGSYDDADKDAEATVGRLVLAVDSGTGTKTVMSRGYATNTGWAFTAGQQLFVGDSGAITSTAPSASGDFVQVVGWATAATTVYFNPSPDYLEIA